MADSATLFLARHGATPLNDAGDERLRGWLDVPLATPGIVAARRAARALQPHQPARLYTSDLTRALDTAKIMSVTLGLTPERMRDLRPWDLGQMAGHRIAEVQADLEHFVGAGRNAAPPGSSESFAAFLRRIKRVIAHLLQETRQLGEPIVAVTHARCLYALEEIIFGNPIPVTGAPEPGAVLCLAGPLGSVTVTTIYDGRPLEAGAVS